MGDTPDWAKRLGKMKTGMTEEEKKKDQEMLEARKAALGNLHFDPQFKTFGGSSTRGQAEDAAKLAEDEKEKKRKELQMRGF